MDIKGFAVDVDGTITEDGGVMLPILFAGWRR